MSFSVLDCLILCISFFCKLLPIFGNLIIIFYYYRSICFLVHLIWEMVNAMWLWFEMAHLITDVFIISGSNVFTSMMHMPHVWFFGSFFSHPLFKNHKGSWNCSLISRCSDFIGFFDLEVMWFLSNCLWFFSTLVPCCKFYIR